MRNVIVFTEGGQDYGYGHIMRCFAVSEGFLKKNIPVKFYVFGHNVVLPKHSRINFVVKDWISDPTFVDNIVNKDSITIVDSYHSSIDLCYKIFMKSGLTIFFDDTNRIVYPGGIVINGIIGAEKINYPKVNGIHYLLGCKYQVLRKEFLKKSKYIIKKNINRIMITFGGSDPTNQTPTYLNLIKKYYPEKKIDVVIGFGFKNLKEICPLKESYIKFHYSPNAKRMKRIMLSSDLVISAAGQTISELAVLGIPTIGVKIIENQENIMRFWKESGFLIDEKKIKTIDYSTRLKSSKSGKKILDSFGVKRIVELCLK